MFPSDVKEMRKKLLSAMEETYQRLAVFHSFGKTLLQSNLLGTLE